MLVEDTVIIELKSVRKLALCHEVQLVNYLVATGKPVGLLLNFGGQGVEVKRKVRELKSDPAECPPIPSCLSCYPVGRNN